MSFFDQLFDFTHLPDPVRDPEHRQELAWADRFVAEELSSQVPVRVSAESAGRILAQARRIYEERRDDFDAIDAKAGEILKTSGLVSTILAAAVTVLKLPITGGLAATFAILLLAVLVSVWARRPMRRASEPTARAALGGSAFSPVEFDLWLASGIHLAADEIRVAVDWKGRRLGEATALLVFGLIALVPAILLWALV